MLTIQPYFQFAEIAGIAEENAVAVAALRNIAQTIGEHERLIVFDRDRGMEISDQGLEVCMLSLLRRGTLLDGVLPASSGRLLFRVCVP